MQMQEELNPVNPPIEDEVLRAAGLPYLEILRSGPNYPFLVGEKGAEESITQLRQNCLR